MNSDTSMPSPESVHISVLLNEAVDALAPKAGGRYLDGTVGMGGHSFAIMERTGGEGFLCGLDRDTQALELARIRLAPFGDRVHLVHTRYSEFEAALDGIPSTGPSSTSASLRSKSIRRNAVSASAPMGPSICAWTVIPRNCR